MTVQVEFNLEIPETIQEPTQAQIEEWIKFQVGYRADMSGTNPLVEEEINGNVNYIHIYLAK